MEGECHESPHQVWNLVEGVELDKMTTPAPQLALEHFMEAVEGDGSAWSYLLASFLMRDGEELAAAWHGAYSEGPRSLVGQPVHGTSAG